MEIVKSSEDLSCGPQIFRVEVIRLPKPTLHGVWNRVRVVRTDNGGVTWTVLPMRIALGSRIHTLFRTWPPERFDEASCEDGAISFCYRDEWIPFERPMLGVLDREAAWKATFNPLGRRWHLRRLRFIVDANGDLIDGEVA